MPLNIPPLEWPKIYNMVNLGGIDLATANGSVVPGIYQKITAALTSDHIEVFYNWKFADIVLPPSKVVIDVSVANQYTINEEILVKSDDTVGIIGFIRIPIIVPLTADENRVYDIPTEVDGFGPVTVNVPAPTPTLVSLNATENGAYQPSTGVDGFSDVTVNVPDIPPVVEPLSVSANGTYEPASGVDGFSRVVVAVPSALSWPSVSEAVEDSMCVAKLIKTVPYVVPYVSTKIQTFYDSYSRTPKPAGMTSEHTYVAGDIYKSIAELGLTFAGELEYYGNVYGNNSIITDCGLVLLGDFADNSSAGPFTLLDSISNYSGIVLNGIYNRQKTSGYNTSMLYFPVNLGVGYWAGMKDRNHSYDCFVTFDTNTQVTLSGNKQVIIYGIP